MYNTTLLRALLCCSVLSISGAAQTHKIDDPYSTVKSKWIKVNTHVHTTITGRSMTPCQAASAYAAAGYGAIVLSDKSQGLWSGPVTADPGTACDTFGSNKVNI